MTDTNQLPQSEREAFEAEMRCEETWGHRSLKRRPDGRYQNWQVDLMWEAWQARAQVQGEPVCGAQNAESDPQAPLSLTAAPQQATPDDMKVYASIADRYFREATQAEVAAEQILEVAEPFGAFEYGDAQGDKRIDFARAILALRPERVPMTDDERGEAYLKQSRSSEGPRSTFMRGVFAAEAHHNIKPKEQA